MESEWTVIGSKGDEYSVKKVGDNFTCQCLGYYHQEKCYHIEKVRLHVKDGTPIDNLHQEHKIFN
jgi:hypothetical protein